jgi:ELP3 family radical SAM enzyme/protein acetyltransferase
MYQHISLRFNGSLSHLLKQWLDQKPFINELPLSENITRALQAMRELPTDPTMEAISYEQDINTKAPCCRVVGIVVETRPDRINRATLQEMRMEGVTRVQLGIQSTDDSVLEFNNRGHRCSLSIKANKFLRDAGFKVDGHLMPDLPGTTLETDYKMMKDVFTGSDLQLDYTKIYPCLDLPFTQIREWKETGEWKPIAENNFPEFLTFLCDTLAMVPPWTRVNRVQRDFPEANAKNGGLGYVSDTIKTNLQQIVKNTMDKRGMQCFDIRSREVGSTFLHNLPDHAKLYIRIYRANQGTEFFISVESPKKPERLHFDDSYLLGLCRLRIPDHEFTDKTSVPIPIHYVPAFRRPSGRVARIRELHTYGSISSSVCNATGNTQHKGIGKFLISVAENISTIYECTSISVISGVGVRDYYKKLGYVLRKTYMVKDLNESKHGSMTLFGKYYSYTDLKSVVRSSTISKKYILQTEENVTETNTGVGVRHVYSHIQNGEAEGFSIEGRYKYQSRVRINLLSIIFTFTVILIILLTQS